VQPLAMQCQAWAHRVLADSLPKRLFLLPSAAAGCGEAAGLATCACQTHQTRLQQLRTDATTQLAQDSNTAGSPSPASFALQRTERLSRAYAGACRAQRRLLACRWWTARLLRRRLPARSPCALPESHGALKERRWMRAWPPCTRCWGLQAPLSSALPLPHAGSARDHASLARPPPCPGARQRRSSASVRRLLPPLQHGQVQASALAFVKTSFDCYTV